MDTVHTNGKPPKKSKRLALMKMPGGKAKVLPMLHGYLDPLLKGARGFHEVFVGAGPLLLSVAERFPDLRLFANDLDPNVSSFWAVLADTDNTDFDALMGRLDIVPTIEMFWQERFRSTCPDRTRVEKAFHCVFFHKTTFSGMYLASPIGGKEQTGKWKVGCHYTAPLIIKRMKEARRRVVGRLNVAGQHVKDYLPWVDERDVLYLDPPYYVAGPQLYAVAMKHKEHVQLAESLKAVKAQWVLSYDSHPVIENLYQWADIRREGFRYSSSSFSEEGKWKEKTEFVIMKKVPLCGTLTVSTTPS
jgi:DNA adenine methylase